MKTVVETPTFVNSAGKEWSIDERLEFISWIAANSDAGDVIPGADGVRKVRWSTSGVGKRGGVRVIYYNIDHDLLLLIDMYRKNKKSNVTLSEIKRAK
jgi:hypothetical protein